MSPFLCVFFFCVDTVMCVCEYLMYDVEHARVYACTPVYNFGCKTFDIAKTHRHTYPPKHIEHTANRRKYQCSHTCTQHSIHVHVPSSHSANRIAHPSIHYIHRYMAAYTRLKQASAGPKAPPTNLRTLFPRSQLRPHRHGGHSRHAEKSSRRSMQRV